MNSATGMTLSEKIISRAAGKDRVTPGELVTCSVLSGFPLLSLVRRSFNQDEMLVDYLHALYHPDRFQYHMDLTPEQTESAKRNSKNQ